eukprot:NODE_11_length_46995_cov_0.451872.p11 type:complete len:394 gc:universal NODE_11_length_46995_cov_0.451872:33939-35120(+)
MTLDVENLEVKEIMAHWRKRESQILSEMEEEAKKKVMAQKKQSKVELSPDFLIADQVRSSRAKGKRSKKVNTESISKNQGSTAILEISQMAKEQLEYYETHTIYLFNTVPLYGIQYMLSHFFQLEDLICLFYNKRDLVDPSRLGLWIADNPLFLPRYVSMFSFKHLLPLDAFSRLLKYIQPAKSTKSLTTLLRAFVAKYVHDNKVLPAILKFEGKNVLDESPVDAYEIYTLIYAAVMVHSEYNDFLQKHPKKNKVKITWTEKKFAKLLGNITKIPKAYIVSIYREVIQGQLFIKYDYKKINDAFITHSRIESYDLITSGDNAQSLTIDHSPAQKRYFDKLKGEHSDTIRNYKRSRLRKTDSGISSNFLIPPKTPVLELPKYFEDKINVSGDEF